MTKLKKQPMTMIELIVAMTVLMVMMGFLMQMIWRAQLLSRSSRGQTEMFQQQRLLFHIIGQDLNGMVTNDSDGAAINYSFDTSELVGTALGFKGMFISSSGIGVSSNDSHTLLEVGYKLDSSDSKIYRWMSSSNDNSGNSNSQWNFFNQSIDIWGNPGDTIGGWEDSSVVSDAVLDFSITPYNDTGVALTSADDTYVTPTTIRVSVTMIDPRYLDESYTDDQRKNFKRTFTKMFYLKRGNIE